MPKIQPVLAATVLLVGVSVTLTGCFGAGAPDLDPANSPLTEYMSAVYGDQNEEAYAEQSRQVEELVSACMSEEGFEYIPVDQSQYMSFEGDDVDRDTEEWVAANGYGVNLTKEQQEEQNSSYEEFVDPNQDYVTSLSESQATAYYEVLYGPGPTEDQMGEDGSYEYSWEDSGCYGGAQHEINGEQAYDQEQFKPIFEAMNTLYEDVSKDPRTKALDAQWASCMADAGFTKFKGKQDAAQSIYDAQNAYWETHETEPDADYIKEARDLEIDTALADFRCGKKVDYTNKQLAVQFALEEQFIKDHQSELDELTAFAEEKKN